MPAARIRSALFMLVLMPCGAFASSIADLSLIYNVRFDDGTLAPSVDTLGFGSLKLGDAGVSGQMSTWLLENGGLTMGVTQPAGSLAAVSVGAFATPVDFAAGSIFGMRATFIAPEGPHETGNIWAVVLGARTGNEQDLFAETRTGATFQTRGTVARLNVLGASVPPTPQDLSQDVYDAIYDPINPSPFTLEVLVDRVTGVGYEALYLGPDPSFSRTFNFAAFTAIGGPSITSIGPSLAISNAPGQSASVRLLDFQIFGEASAVPEPASWMLLSFGLLLIVAARLPRKMVRNRPLARSPRVPDVRCDRHTGLLSSCGL